MARPRSKIPAALAATAWNLGEYPQDDLPEFAFAGRSNVGKSSLINSLLGVKGLADTSKKPGRTRGLYFYSTPWNFRVVDLPGYGFARAPDEEKERWQGLMEDYLLNRPNLKAVLCLVDCRHERQAADDAMFNWLTEHDRDAICVLTKADKLSRGAFLQQAQRLKERLFLNHTPFPFSSLSGQGRDDLLRWIKEKSVTELKK